MSKKGTRSKNTSHEKRARKQRQWEHEDKTLRELRAKAPYVKLILRGRGCKLPFYDYLDSYSDEFQRIAITAKKEHPSIIGIHEVDDRTFATSEECWSQLGYADLQQVFFNIERCFSDYGTASPDANLCGSMTAFLDADQNVRSVILIRQTVKGAGQHRELKYALKIASLLHEVGHVQDLEERINFDVPTRRFDVIEAEVFAHLFALERMAQRNLRQSFNMLADGLRDTTPKGGYGAEVARKVLERLPPYQLIDWQSVFFSQVPTPEELKKLGPKGIDAIGS